MTKHTFDSDLRVGQEFEALVRARLGGVETSRSQRDLGDMILPGGLFVECKHDIGYDTYGNVAIEVADLEPSHGITVLTGVFKHAANGHRTVIVHGLGKVTHQLLVYSPYAMTLALGGGLAALPVGSSLKSWPNHNTGDRNRTAGVITPGPIKWPTDQHGMPLTPPLLPVEVCTPSDLVATVRRVAAAQKPEHSRSWSSAYVRLASGAADHYIARCFSRVVSKDQYSDQVHAIVRGEQASLG